MDGQTPCAMAVGLFALDRGLLFTTGPTFLLRYSFVFPKVTRPVDDVLTLVDLCNPTRNPLLDDALPSAVIASLMSADVPRAMPLNLVTSAVYDTVEILAISGTLFQNSSVGFVVCDDGSFFYDDATGCRLNSGESMVTVRIQQPVSVAVEVRRADVQSLGSTVALCPVDCPRAPFCCVFLTAHCCFVCPLQPEGTCMLFTGESYTFGAVVSAGTDDCGLLEGDRVFSVNGARILTQDTP